MSRSAFVFVALAVIGCSSEHDLKNGTPNNAAGDPDIELSTNALQFGPVPGGDTDYQSVTVSNVGDATLTVSDLVITAGDEVFWVETSPTGFDLEPGEQTEVEVGFSPDLVSINYGSLSVFSDDPDEPESIVDLLGTGQVPELALDPIDFTFPSGCEDTMWVTMKNVGLDTLTINDMRYLGDSELDLESILTLPLDLAPGEEAGVTVRYSPTSGNPVAGTLEVRSNDPAGVKSADQDGTPDVGHVVDTFNTVGDPPIDIVFAIDKSCSMDDDVRAIANAFDQFIVDIGNVTQDWRIGVATRDSGCFNQGIITPATPNYQDVFGNAVRGVQFLGTNYTEALLQLTSIALHQTVSSGCNAGFSRANAVLHIITVSDEPEQSGTDWSVWVAEYAAAKADPALLKISAVADINGTCGSSPDGYVEAANATGGLALDICNSNWGNYAAQLGSVSAAALRTFPLSAVPEVNTITVSMNGSTYATGWHYDAAQNAVVVDVPIPDGQTLEIGYDAIGC